MRPDGRAMNAMDTKASPRWKRAARQSTMLATASLFAACAHVQTIELQRDATNSAVAARVADASSPTPKPSAFVTARGGKWQGGVRLSDEEKAVFDSDAFKRRFAAGWMPEGGFEPELKEGERESLVAVIDFIDKEKFEEAEIKARSLIKDDCSASVDFMLGHVLARRKKYKEAVTWYSKATEKFPRFRRAWLAKTDAAMRGADFPIGAKSAARVIALGGGDGDLWGALATAHLKLERYVSAEYAFRMASTLDPERARWRKGLAETFFAQERYAEVAAFLDELIREQPDAHDLWTMQGQSYAYLERWQRAAENFELVDGLGKASPDLLGLLGGVYAKQENFRMAVDAYLRAIRKSPKVKVTQALDTARFMVGADAIDEVRMLLAGIADARGDALSKEEKLAELRIRASLAVATDQGDEAHAKLLQEIVRLNPLDGNALILLGRHLAREKKEAEAITLFERAASVDKFRAQAQLRHAELLVRSKRYEKALPLLRSAYQLKPRDVVKRLLDDVARIVNQRKGS